MNSREANPAVQTTVEFGHVVSLVCSYWEYSYSGSDDPGWIFREGLAWWLVTTEIRRSLLFFPPPCEGPSRLPGWKREVELWLVWDRGCQVFELLLRGRSTDRAGQRGILLKVAFEGSVTRWKLQKGGEGEM